MLRSVRCLIPTFRDYLWVPSSRVLNSLTLEDGTARWSRNVAYKTTLPNITTQEDVNICFNRCESLRSRVETGQSPLLDVARQRSVFILKSREPTLKFRPLRIKIWLATCFEFDRFGLNADSGSQISGQLLPLYEGISTGFSETSISYQAAFKAEVLTANKFLFSMLCCRFLSFLVRTGYVVAVLSL